MHSEHMNTFYYQVSCFGKLPRFGDFVRFNSGGSEVRAFELWIQEGLYYAQKHYDREWNDVYQHSPEYQFLFNPNGTDRFLLGALRPSHDKSDRKYPFIVTLRIGKDLTDGADVFAYFPVMLSQFLQQTAPVLDQADQALTPQDLANEAEQLNEAVAVDMEEALGQFKDFLQGTSLAQFWEDVLGRADDPRRFRLIKNLSEILLPLRGNPTLPLTLGLRFPLGQNGASVHREVCFWILAVARMLGDSPLAPNAFWGSRGEGTERFLFLYLQPPSSKNMIQLVRPRVENDAVCHLEEEGKDISPEAALSGLSPELRSAFLEGQTSLSDFLGLL